MPNEITEQSDPIRPAAPGPKPATGAVDTSGAADGRVRALVGLLADANPQVRAAVKVALAEGGSSTLRALRRAARSDQALLRVQARRALFERERAVVVRRLLRHVSRPRLELEPALFLLARIEHPHLDARPYRRAMDAMAREVRQRAEREAPGLGRPLCVAQYLGQELGYAGSPEAYHHPDRIHLHRTIETKLGMPLTLSALYVFVARRAGIRAGIVPLPGHVMLRLYAEPAETAAPNKQRSLLVDPFHRGALRTRRECQKYLSEHGLANEPSWFRDAEDDALFLRQVRNLHHSARTRGLGSLARELERVARALVHARGGRVPGRKRS